MPSEMNESRIKTYFYIQKSLVRLSLLIYNIILIPIVLNASVEKELYPGSFTCQQVDSLINEAFSYKTFDIGKFKYLSNQALIMAKSLSCKSQEALAFIHVGSCFFLRRKIL